MGIVQGQMTTISHEHLLQHRHSIAFCMCGHCLLTPHLDLVSCSWILPLTSILKPAVCILPQAQSAAVVQSITHLAQSQVAASCTRWLQEVAGDCLQAGPQILAACSTAAQLVEVEGAVRGASSAWRAPSEGPAAAGAHLPGAVVVLLQLRGGYVDGDVCMLAAAVACCAREPQHA